MQEEKREMTNPYLCLFMISLLSPLGLLEENILPSSNTGPEDDWLPGSNPWVFDSASNPILRPPDLLEWILGDPAVVQLGGKIHMFAYEVFCGLLKSGEISVASVRCSNLLCQEASQEYVEDPSPIQN